MRNRLAELPSLERHYSDDHNAQLAALRVVLGLPARLASLRREVAG